MSKRDETCQCAFCGTASTLDNAIEVGWVPSFWIEAKHGGQAFEAEDHCCGDCARYHLEFDDDGEAVLKKFHGHYLRLIGERNKAQR